MRTLEEIEAAFWDDKRSMDGDESILFIREAHALGRSEGYAEGVEAVLSELRPMCGHSLNSGTLAAARALALSALLPSPATGTAPAAISYLLCPNCDGYVFPGEAVCPICHVSPQAPCPECGLVGCMCRVVTGPATSPAEDAPRCPGCGAELSADHYAMAVRKHAFRPGLTNNPGGWAAPITGECQACGRSTTGGDK